MSSPLKNIYIRVNWHNKYSSRFAVVSSPLPYRSADDNVPPLALYNVGICWVVVVVVVSLCSSSSSSPRAILQRQTIGLLRSE